MHHVGSFHHLHAFVLPEFPIEDAVTGVNGEDMGDASLEQAVGESTRAAAEVGTSESSDIQFEDVQGMIQFLTCSGHPSSIGVI